MFSSTPSPPAAGPIGARAWWIASLLAALAASLVVLLGPQWLSNPDLSHGLFAPIGFLLLLHEARRHGTRRYLAPALASGLGVLALGIGILGLVAGGLYATALEWTHALVGFTLAGSFGCAVVAAIAVLSSRNIRLIAFNWNALAAAAVWILSAPIPPGTYTRLTLALQLWISENVLRALHLLGIAAKQNGNIIELARTTVGVEDACSGVRSLISCVFAGVFFSGTLVRTPWARVSIIAIAAPLAISMNFVRSLTLTLLANGGVPIEGRWHDLTGYAILASTAILLGLFAFWLGAREKRVPPADTAPHDAPVAASGSPPHWLAAGLGFGALVAAFFVFHAPLTPPSVRTAPDVEAALPLSESGWQVITAGDLNRFEDTLQTDRFVQRTYSRQDSDGVFQVTVYIAYWAPGQASASLVATHTPDACWPGAGWESFPVAAPRVELALASRTLAAAEYRFFRYQGNPQHVWFWHLYDGKPIHYINPLSPRNLLEIAARFGFRRAGDQMFVRISSNRPWATISNEPLVGEILARLRPLGL